MKKIPRRPFQLLILPVLLVMIIFVGTGRSAFALVKSQATDVLNAGQTFCLPVQQVSANNGGKVVGGGSSFANEGPDLGSPIATEWTIHNGPTSNSLQVISQVTQSFSAPEKIVPIGSFLQTCMTNTTNVQVAFSIEQAEVSS